MPTATSSESAPDVPEWFSDWFDDKFAKGDDPFRPPEVWATLGCSKISVYRAIWEGELNVMRVGDRYIIPRHTLRDWLRSKYFTRGAE